MRVADVIEDVAKQVRMGHLHVERWYYADRDALILHIEAVDNLVPGAKPAVVDVTRCPTCHSPQVVDAGLIRGAGPGDTRVLNLLCTACGASWNVAPPPMKE